MLVLGLLGLTCTAGMSSPLPAADRTHPSWWRRRLPRRTRDCSVICCRSCADRTGITVKVIAQGTGQALETARRGDADVVFVHDAEAEARFVAEGHGLDRHPVMYNDFRDRRSGRRSRRSPWSKDVANALQAIQGGRFPFVSRGDRSGTHQAELRLWKAAGVEHRHGLRSLVSRGGSGHGTGAQHRSRPAMPMSSRTARPGSAFATRARCRCWSKAMRASSTSTA